MNEPGVVKEYFSGANLTRAVFTSGRTGKSYNIKSTGEIKRIIAEEKTAYGKLDEKQVEEAYKRTQGLVWVDFSLDKLSSVLGNTPKAVFHRSYYGISNVNVMAGEAKKLVSNLMGVVSKISADTLKKRIQRQKIKQLMSVTDTSLLKLTTGNLSDFKKKKAEVENYLKQLEEQVKDRPDLKVALPRPYAFRNWMDYDPETMPAKQKIDELKKTLETMRAQLSKTRQAFNKEAEDKVSVQKELDNLLSSVANRAGFSYQRGR